MHAEPGGAWRITDSAGYSAHFDDKRIRHSILWKAYAFADPQAHSEFLDHTNDLTYEQTVAILNADLERRGIAIPKDDREWKLLVQRTFRARDVLGA